MHEHEFSLVIAPAASQRSKRRRWRGLYSLHAGAVLGTYLWAGAMMSVGEVLKTSE